jgi:hypothetical protein
VNVSIGNFRGTVLYFNDYYIIPEGIRAMFADPKCTKIGSGLIAEMEQFGRLHVRLRNWVEVGSMRMALYPPAWAMFQEKVRNRAALDIEGEIQIGHGLRYMTQDLVEAEYFPEGYRRTEFDYLWERRPHQFNSAGKPPPQMLTHLIENIRTPCAEVVMIVEHFARLRGYNLATEPFWPIAYEAFDLCRLKSPEIFQANLGSEWTVFNWMARVSTGDRIDQNALPSQCMEMHHFKNARADFVEPYFRGDLRKIADEVFFRFFGPDGIEFPSYNQMGQRAFRTLLKERCPQCGHRKTPSHRCSGPYPECIYPHDGVEFPPHSLLCCPNLHNHCRTCLTIGHQTLAHHEPSILKTTRELRKRYFEFAAQGLFTSVPFLVNHPQGRERLASPHWKTGYDGKRYSAAIEMRFVLGASQHTPLSPLGEFKRKQEEELHRRQDKKMLEAVHANAILVDTNFKSVPRDLRTQGIVEDKKKEKEERLNKELMARAAKEKRRENERESKRRGLEKQRQAAKEKEASQRRKIVFN